MKEKISKESASCYEVATSPDYPRRESSLKTVPTRKSFNSHVSTEAQTKHKGAPLLTSRGSFLSALCPANSSSINSKLSFLRSLWHYLGHRFPSELVRICLKGCVCLCLCTCAREHVLGVVYVCKFPRRPKEVTRCIGAGVLSHPTWVMGIKPPISGRTASHLLKSIYLPFPMPWPPKTAVSNICPFLWLFKAVG